jgi:hypothetical protein
MNSSVVDDIRAHLVEFSTVINNFCARNYFELVPILAIGTYPRIRIQRCEDITRWIELWMAFDENGKRFTKFFDQIPYELSAGASFIQVCEGSESSLIERHQHSFLIWNRPFSDVLSTLDQDLEGAFQVLLGWDKQFLIENGVKVHIS